MIRDGVNIKPDLMGDCYEFVKINVDDLISFLDEKNRSYRSESVIEDYLNSERSDYNWFVTPHRIYYTSNEKGPFETIQKDIVEKAPMGWPYPSADFQERITRAGTKVYTNPPENKFSETQKWVSRLQEKQNENGKALNKEQIRTLIREIVGK